MHSDFREVRKKKYLVAFSMVFRSEFTFNLLNSKNVSSTWGFLNFSNSEKFWATNSSDITCWTFSPFFFSFWNSYQMNECSQPLLLCTTSWVNSHSTTFQSHSLTTLSLKFVFSIDNFNNCIFYFQVSN